MRQRQRGHMGATTGTCGSDNGDMRHFSIVTHSDHGTQRSHHGTHRSQHTRTSHTHHTHHTSITSHSDHITQQSHTTPQHEAARSHAVQAAATSQPSRCSSSSHCEGSPYAQEQLRFHSTANASHQASSLTVAVCISFSSSNPSLHLESEPHSTGGVVARLPLSRASVFSFSATRFVDPSLASSPRCRAIATFSCQTIRHSACRCSHSPFACAPSTIPTPVDAG